MSRASMLNVLCTCRTCSQRLSNKPTTNTDTVSQTDRHTSLQMVCMWACNFCVKLKLKAKVSDSYIAHLTGKPDQLCFTIIGIGSWLARVNGAAALMWPSIACATVEVRIIYDDDDCTLSLILAGLDTLESRRAHQTKPFFKRNVLPESSCLHYLLPERRDASVTGPLRRARTFEPLIIRTVKFRNSFIPHCLSNFD